MSSKHFGKRLELGLIVQLGRVLVVVLGVYLVLRVQDLYYRGALRLVARPTYETALFLVEVAAGLALPLALLLVPRVRSHPTGLYLASVLVLLGFIANRLNVSVTGMEGAAGLRYVPRWTEAAVTAAIVGAGIGVFALAARYLPIFPPEEAAPSG